MRLSALCALVLTTGCATEQQRTHFPVEIAGAPVTAPTERGWTIRLDAASAEVGPVRFFQGHVLLGRRIERLLWMPFGGVAQAHPGHYVAGEAMGELLSTKVVDLLAPAPVELGSADAVTGEYGSLQLTLRALHIAGRATKDGQEVRFNVTSDLPGPLDGVRSEREVDLSPQRVRITVQLATWLDRVDYTTAAASEPSAPAGFPESSQAYNAFIRGAIDTGAYVVTWSP